MRLEEIKDELCYKLVERGFSRGQPFSRVRPTEQFRFQKLGSVYGIQAGLDEEFWDTDETKLRCFYVNFDYNVPKGLEGRGEIVVPDPSLTRAVLSFNGVGFELIASPASNPRTQQFQATCAINLDDGVGNVQAVGVTVNLIDYIAKAIELNCNAFENRRKY